MQQITFPVGPLACNCSIVAADGARDAFVIDPGDRTDFILQWLAQRELRLGGILITHAHIDHIGGAAGLRQATGAPVYLNPRDQFLNEGLEWQAQWLGVPTPESAPVDEALRENQALTLGGLRFEILETPGHTPGSVCLYLASAARLFAGDTLFAGSIGRTDLPGGDGAAILRSIRDKLLPLPDATIVIPGHGPETTIGRERGRNPFLRDL